MPCSSAWPAEFAIVWIPYFSRSRCGCNALRLICGILGNRLVLSKPLERDRKPDHDRSRCAHFAGVAELADANDSKSFGVNLHLGSTPSTGTHFHRLNPIAVACTLRVPWHGVSGRPTVMSE
jgi:hypothetical protein